MQTLWGGGNIVKWNLFFRLQSHVSLVENAIFKLCWVCLYSPRIVVKRFTHAHEHNPCDRVRIPGALEEALSHNHLLHNLQIFRD